MTNICPKTPQKLTQINFFTLQPLFSVRLLEHVPGFTFNVTNPLIEDWLQSWNAIDPLLDLGCGNCLNTKQALDIGATVFATEMSQKALTHLRQEHADKKEQLSFHYLELPDHVVFPDNHFSGILCSEVFHFLDHQEVIQSAQHLHRMLISGGKIALTCACEELKALEPIGLKHIKQTQRETNPDRLDAIQDNLHYLEKAATIHSFNQHGSNLLVKEIMELHHVIQYKKYFNYFQPEQLAKVFAEAGFDIEFITMGPAPYYPLWEHGGMGIMIR